MGLPRDSQPAFRADNRASDLNGFYPGLGLHDRIGTPDLRAPGWRNAAAPGAARRCPTRSSRSPVPGPGRLLVIADSFGDEIGGDFSRVCRTGLAGADEPGAGHPSPPIAAAIGFHPDAVIVAYHDAGALALDAASQASLALAARLLGDAGLPAPAAHP